MGFDMGAATENLAQAIGRLAQTDGNYATAIPALSLFRRSTTTEPMPCIYGFGLAITVQGGKRVMLGDQVFHYGPGQALLMTVDVPVVSHVTRATPAEPYLGMVLLLESPAIVRLAAEMALPPPAKEDTYRAISLEQLDGGIHDALMRLLHLLDEPHLVPHVAPLLVQEIAMRLLTGAHASKLRHFASVDSPGPYEPIHLQAAFPQRGRHEPAAIPKTTAPAGSPAVDAEPQCRRRQCRHPGGL
jgi:hypothetical protein